MSNRHGKADIVVIGAGIVGLATAWALIERGREVTVLDPGPPGGQASSGNAATLAGYAVEPLAHPGLLTQLPALLLSPSSPFHLRWRHLPRLAPWLWRFLAAATPARTAAATRTLHHLLAPAMDDWQALHATLGTGTSATALHRRGALTFFRQRRHWQAERDAYIARERLGIPQRYLDARQVAELEPALEGVAQGGVHFLAAGHLADPQALATRLASRLAERGVDFRTARVTGLDGAGGRVRIDSDLGSWLAEHAIVAAGPWSATLARCAGDRIPLDVERGYHLEFPDASTRLSRPCNPAENAFYMTPLAGRLRIAGTVELGHPRDPANPRRLAYLRRHGEALLGPLGPASHEWLGLRPSLPDSLPVIGPARLPGVTYAFGHGHLGLTLAPTTGRLVAESLSGASPSWLEACHPQRFTR
ncbi:NAD(P)/FAD-dependent oxidoreductase [Billgrantia gudaonensis]|uniref:D-amino-acid dehydrogenase n=1 Tax=Billgrantia gudaonensis TaxID=376427 RepID=A0A1G8U209_9GAMM|nr:FAD-dependent oxidoreductase [Halomonas gudaonensis]SDJ47664.1 D-amino-acid dehydrogenase [Halomonas gudaonensis]